MTPTSPPDTATQEWYTREEAARYLRVSTFTLDRMRRAGTLLSARTGRSVRLRREWLDAALPPADPVS